MKKMITYEEFIKLVEDVNLLKGKTLSDIVDSDGHKRFVTFDLDAKDIEGINFSYAKASLSGNHLMIVLSGTIEANTTISENTTLADIRFPEYIADKIISPSGNDEFIDFKTSNYTGNGFTSAGTLNTYLYKVLNSNYLSIQLLPTISVEQDVYFRIAYDLIID